MKALVQIEGRLGKNPETRELPRGRKVTRFSVAVNKKIRISSWVWGGNWYPRQNMKRPPEGGLLYIECD